MQNLPTKQKNNLQALCALSDTPAALNLTSLTILIQESPDPATALKEVFNSIPNPSDALKAKWQKIVRDIWAAHHTHIPELLNLPLTTNEIIQTNALNEAREYLKIVKHKPLHMINEGKEWLVSPEDVNHLAAQLPTLHNQPTIQAENEWQYLLLHRLRSTLESLRLVRRYRDQLILVKSRYQKFNSLPTVQQYYLLWHAEAYHTNWSEYSGAWGDYLQIVQEYLPLLWNVSIDKEAGHISDVRQWNQEVIENFYPIWQQEGLLEQQASPNALLTMVRFQSLPTALTQVIIKDLLGRYGMIYGEGMAFAYTSAGIKQLTAEYNQDLPCHIEVL